MGDIVLLTGRIGSGISDRALEFMREERTRGARPLFYIVPEQYAAEAELRAGIAPLLMEFVPRTVGAASGRPCSHINKYRGDVVGATAPGRPRSNN